MLILRIYIEDFKMKLGLFLIFLSSIQLLFAGEWNQKATFGGVARHRSSAFVIGEKGYVGMGHYNTGEHVIFKDFWEYDPATDSWTQKADFGGSLRYQCSGFSIGNYGYLGLGRNAEGNYEQDFWKYDPSANLWYPIANFPGAPRRGATAFVIDDMAYVGCGQTAADSTALYVTDFYKYNPNNNTWTKIADFIGIGRTNPVSFSFNGKGYVGVGHTWSAALNDFYEYNPTSNYWVQKANVGNTLRQDATGFCVMGEGYIGTGNNEDGTENYKDFWKYNFETDIWTKVADFGGVARRYMVSFVINNTAYCWGGTNGTNLKDLWSFNPYLSVDEYDNEVVAVYPNPATTQVVFNLKNITNVSVLVYNSNGQLISTIKNKSNQLVLNRESLPNGLYFYTITSNQQIIKSGKFIFE